MVQRPEAQPGHRRLHTSPPDRSALYGGLYRSGPNLATKPRLRPGDSRILGVDPGRSQQQRRTLGARADPGDLLCGRLSQRQAGRRGGDGACELTRWQDPDCLDTLAAAYAEAGDFQAAVKWQTQAIRLVRENVPSALLQAQNIAGRRGVGFENRLSFYKSNRPTRE